MRKPDNAINWSKLLADDEFASALQSIIGHGD
jgi:hypothetical protein